MGQEMARIGAGEEFWSWYRKGKGNFYIEIWLLKLERIYAYFDICIDMCIDILFGSTVNTDNGRWIILAYIKKQVLRKEHWDGPEKKMEKLMKLGSLKTHKEKASKTR